MALKTAKLFWAFSFAICIPPMADPLPELQEDDLVLMCEIRHGWPGTPFVSQWYPGPPPLEPSKLGSSEIVVGTGSIEQTDCALPSFETFCETA